MFKYKIKQEEFESKDMYNRKKLFLKSYDPKNKKEYEYAINLANILNNILILKCRYPIEIENIVLKNCEKININKK